MSLKIFHILFITLSILLAALVGGWGVQRFLATGAGSSLALGATFFVAGAALVVYAVKVLRKFREIGP